MHGMKRIATLSVIVLSVSIVTACKTSSTRTDQIDTHVRVLVPPNEYNKAEGYEFEVPEIGKFSIKSVTSIDTSGSGSAKECSVDLESLKKEIIARNSQARMANNDEMTISLELKQYDNNGSPGFYCDGNGQTCKAVVIKKPNALLIY